MTKLSVKQFIYDQYQTVPPVVKVDLTGKTVLVIGANTGLGLEAAKHFASMNPEKLVIACRSREKGNDAIRTIETSTGYKGTELRVVDLSNFSSVNEFAERYTEDLGRLDIYVYNAGVAYAAYEATSDGWETILQVNHLSCMLLSLLLLPCMLSSASSSSPYPRMVIVSSDVHYWANLTKDELASPNILEKLNDSNYCNSSVMRHRYGISKMFNVFFVRELVARLPDNSPLIVTTPNPGYCISQLRRHFSPVMALFDKMMEMVLARTTEEGARQLVWAAIGGQGREDELRGAYVSSADVQEPSDYVLSEEGMAAQKRIFDESVEILSKISLKFGAIVQEHLST
ncbi:hypothetical protein EW146_g961 [Bondarzewia mesenterica]|uniref:Short-chain dehydrogenase n=1 Tax=Bondarzewia mesenterica TaxID=1095465 RepID=A0A4S4M589_9AGAM|nr:hypothetical protein EW146_g961 [Bondarzewia mesenterica]